MIKRFGLAPPDRWIRNPEARRACSWPVWIFAALLTAEAALVAGAQRSGASAAPELPAERLVFTQVPVRSDAEISAIPRTLAPGSALPPGSRIVSFDPFKPDREPTNLTRDFSAAGKPDVSFDGQRILFVGQRGPGDPFDVWEMNADGSGLRRITEQVGSCCAAIYLSTIYTMDAEEPVHQVAFCSDAGGGVGHSLYTCRMDGTRVRRITFNPYGATDPCLLSDGRLLFCSGQPSEPGRSGVRGSALFTVNTDGTDVFVFAAAHEPPAIRGMPCETPDGQVVYVESVRGGWDRGGTLIAVSRTASLRTRRMIANDPAGLYRSPSPIGDGNLLVSYRSTDYGSWGIYVLDPRTGTRSATVYDAPQWHELDAAVVRARAEPAGRSSVVNEQVETGLLYCLNAYSSNTERSQRIGDGQIKWLQIFRAITNDNRELNDSTGQEHVEPGSSDVAQELIGAVPVEPDGSFHLRIPARTPLRLQTLDPDGQIVQAMRNWIWVMPNEARGCIGCHEDRELSPPNRHTLALRKPPQSVGVAGNEFGGGSAAREHTTGDAK